MTNGLLEYKALQSLAETKRLAYEHNLLIDDLKAILKRNISFCYHLCIDDVLKHHYVNI